MSTPPPSIRLVKLKDVPAMLESQGLSVTRQTVYNWVSKGKGGHKLRTLNRAGFIFTTKEWVYAFVHDTF